MDMAAAAPPAKRGQLRLILGPMGAGKSSHAAWRFGKYVRDPRNVAVWLHNPVDTRSQTELAACTHNVSPASAVSTHNGPLKIDGNYMSVPLSAATGQPDLAAVRFPAGTTHVFVDEVQFYDCAGVHNIILKQWVVQLGLVVCCVGLLTDKDKVLWPATHVLLMHADKIHFLHARCSCGMAAGHTRAVTTAAALTDDICVGGMKDYAAACINCHPAQL